MRCKEDEPCVMSRKNIQCVKKLGDKIVKGNISTFIPNRGITVSFKKVFSGCAKFSIISIQHFQNKKNYTNMFKNSYW